MSLPVTPPMAALSTWTGVSPANTVNMPLAGSLGPTQDGLAASQMVAKKRERYPPSGGELVPLVFEAGGRASDEAVALLRTYGLGLDDADRAVVLSNLWRRISRVLQFGTADMVLSALR